MNQYLFAAEKVYDLLKGQGVPHAENVYASRDGCAYVFVVEAVVVTVDELVLLFLFVLPSGFSSLEIGE